MSDFAIGDISGYKDGFDELIKHKFISRIIAMGDIIDRGPQSREMIQFFIDHAEHICLMGNHEHMMIKVYEEVMEGKKSPYFSLMWIFVNGGKETLESYGVIFPDVSFSENDIINSHQSERIHLLNLPEVKQVFSQFNKIPKSHIDFFKNLPTFLETDTHFYSHAPINQWKNPKLFQPKSFDENDYFLDVGCLWNRRDPDAPKQDGKILVYGHQNKDKVLVHSPKYPLGKYMDDAETKLPEDYWGVCIDTAKSGYLTGLKADDGTLYYVNLK